MKSKKEIVKSLALHQKDVGSTVVQIGLLSEKIKNLSDHFKKFKKDKHSSRGLTKSVNQRKRLLAYLSRYNPEAYRDLIKKLNLRRNRFWWKKNYFRNRENCSSSRRSNNCYLGRNSCYSNSRRC